jgi:hypothetical protein
VKLPAPTKILLRPGTYNINTEIFKVEVRMEEIPFHLRTKVTAIGVTGQMHGVGNYVSALRRDLITDTLSLMSRAKPLK